MRLPLLSAAIILLLSINTSFAQNYSEYNQQLVDQHVYQGMPGYDNILIRQAYILSYNHEHRIPNWVAYNVEPGYTNTVPRYGIFNSFRVDINIPNPVKDQEYVGLYDAGKGYARGHLAPFNISGGDRDGDGLYGVADTNRDGVVTADDMKDLELWEFVSDANEIPRVYEINHLSNVAPQDHDGFNGGGGIWRDLERYIQNTVVEEEQKEVWVIAGTVLGKGEMEKVGPNNDITVPPMFYKIVVRNDDHGKPLVLAFLLPHHKEAHGEIEDFLVSVDIIEALTGLDFFSEMDDEMEKTLEAEDTWLNWGTF
ncbi:MAG: DNA/RNA non-specific endonuclease [Balneolaceae bacterium]|nr:DNA/RNA non-specific endonuclease [Balneolaceae bacterium]